MNNLVKKYNLKCRDFKLHREAFGRGVRGTHEEKIRNTRIREIMNIHKEIGKRTTKNIVIWSHLKESIMEGS